MIYILVLPVSIYANTYFVAPDGADSNDGSKTNPWETIEHAVNQLKPGDVLNLREGIYYEYRVDLELNGTTSDPVIIQSYPGETAQIDGGISDFKDAPNDLWELVDGSINLYRSKETYPHVDFVNAWLLDEDLHILRYNDMENLTSTNYGPVDGFNPMFFGPGIFLHTNGHLYIRLETNPNDLTDWNDNPIDPVTNDLNPNNHSIAVWFSNPLFWMSDGGGGFSHVTFKDIVFAHSERLFDVRSPSNDIVFENCKFRFGRYGFVFRSGASRDFTFRYNEFSSGLPDFVHWTDVKNRNREVSEAHPEQQSNALYGHMPGFYIHNNLFRDTWEGLDAHEESENIRIKHNHFIRNRDDAVTLRITRNAEVAYNLMWLVGAGVGSKFKADNYAYSGHVYVHHNVIDVSHYQRGGRPGNDRESNWPVWTTIAPFAGHSDSYPAWWKVYNNTVIARQSGYRWNSLANNSNVPGNDELYKMNNIFYSYDHRIIYRDDEESSGSTYDGNVLYRVTAEEPDRFYMFYDFGDGGRYETLEEFRAESGTEWEKNGLEVDPGFDISAMQSREYDPDNMWERYIPSNPDVLTAGASYEGYNWPGTDGVDYRGAIDELGDVPPPSAPVVSDEWRPRNEQEDVSTQPIFMWVGSHNAQEYELRVSDDPDFTNITLNRKVNADKDRDIQIYQITEEELETGVKYYWKIRAGSQHGNSEWSDIMVFKTTGKDTSIDDEEVPFAYNLKQNYPNPFNPTTSITYSIPENVNVRIRLYNAIGQKVMTLVNENKSPGIYEYTLDATNITSGVYYYRMEAGNYVKTRKMLIVK